MSTSVITREDGTLILPTNSDPSIRRVEGYRRYWLGVDLGQTDPTGIVLLQDECIPYLDGFVQKLGKRNRTIVFADFLVDTSYAAILTYLSQLMTRRAIKGRVKLSIDASGIGRPFSNFLTEHQIPHIGIQITAGSSTSRDGFMHNVAKALLLGDLANALETKHLLIAHDLPLRDRLMRELESFEVRVTAAGNQALDASRAAGTGHADLAIAAALALFHSNNVPMAFSEAPIAGYWG